VADRKAAESFRADDRLGKERLQVLRPDLEVAAQLLDEEPAVGADLDLVRAGVFRSLERKEQGAVLRDVVRRRTERLVELERGPAVFRLE
jgi:hypothetical protein